MPFLIQGKTNWNFLLIVVVLAAVAGGGILWFVGQQKAETIHPVQLLETKELEKTAEEETIKEETIEDYVKKYTDEEFGFSIYYPKWMKVDDVIKKCNIQKIQIKKGDYLFYSYWPAGGVNLPWTSYIFYDENKGKCIHYERIYHLSPELNEEDVESTREAYEEAIEREKNNEQKTSMPPSGHELVEPDFYTVFGLPVFSLRERFDTNYIICIYPEKFLMTTNMGTGFAIGETFTKTIARNDQNIEDEKIKKALMEEILRIEEMLAEIEF